jgi:hypothetical protein
MPIVSKWVGSHNLEVTAKLIFSLQRRPLWTLDRPRESAVGHPLGTWRHRCFYQMLGR